jgi:WhiB family redox-sensing transcriptional regulator
VSAKGSPVAFSRDDDSWMQRGTCYVERAPVDLFILEQGYQAEEAKTYCRRCPVQFECLQYARRTNSIGVWGGKVFSFKPEVPDVSPRPMFDVRPVIKKVIYFDPGKEPGILGASAVNFQKPGIFG